MKRHRILMPALLLLGAACAQPATGRAGAEGYTPIPVHDEVGLASWYGDPFHGRRTASGVLFD